MLKPVRGHAGPEDAYRTQVLAEAEAICRGESLEGTPEVLYVRGLLASRSGLNDAAVACMSRALALDPSLTGCANALADLWIRSGQPQDVLGLLLDATRRARTEAGLFVALARVLRCNRSSLGGAVLALQEAEALEPAAPSVQIEFGNLLLQQDCISEAIERFGRALTLQEGNVQACRGLAEAYIKRREWTEAIECLRLGLRLNDANADLWVDFGRALLRTEAFADAEAACRTALALQPRHIGACRQLILLLEAQGQMQEAAQVWVSIGVAFQQQCRFIDAEIAYRHAIARQSSSLRARIGFGQLCLALGRPREAIDHLEAAIALDADQGLAHTELGKAYQTIGDIHRGWDEFRWYCPTHSLKSRGFEQPVWSGTPLEGKTILLWADQALGDTIQFLRYVPIVRALGATVIVECQPRLRPLVARMPGVLRTIVRGEPLVPFDVHVPLTLVPVVLRDSRWPIPAPVPYLSVDEQMIRIWRRRLQSNGALTVGISWAGAPEGIHAQTRFVPLSAFAPLGGASGVRFISLQMGPQEQELLRPPPGLRVASLQKESSSILETAALMCSLDLILSVDTMVPHLAGALGRPVWLTLAKVPEWRWAGDSDRTPWYPTMRLFRQPTAGDWRSVFTNVRRALELTLRER